MYFPSCGHLWHSFRTGVKGSMEESRSCVKTRTSYNRRACGFWEKMSRQNQILSICQYNPYFVSAYLNMLIFIAFLETKVTCLHKFSTGTWSNCEGSFSYLLYYQKCGAISIWFIRSLLQTVEREIFSNLNDSIIFSIAATGFWLSFYLVVQSSFLYVCYFILLFPQS